VAGVPGVVGMGTATIRGVRPVVGGVTVKVVDLVLSAAVTIHAIIS
jgi:hypothetical protein